MVAAQDTLHAAVATAQAAALGTVQFAGLVVSCCCGLIIFIIIILIWSDSKISEVHSAI